MQQNAPLADQLVIQNVLIERMRETVTYRQRPIRKVLFAQSGDQTVNLFKASELLLKVKLVNVEQLSNDCRKKLGSLDTRVCQRSSLLFLERINCFVNHAAYALRRLEIHFGKWPRQRPVLVRPRDVAAFGQKLHQT